MSLLQPYPLSELPKLVDVIQRDAFSWRNIAFYYFKFSKEDISTIDSNIFADGSIIFHAQNNKFIYIGKILDKIPNDVSIILSIPDIALAVEQALAILCNEIESSHTVAIENPVILSDSISVLLVEDELVTKKMVENFLSKHVKTITAENERSASANYAVQRPDIVFLDLHYQGDIYDGFDVISNILAFDPNAYVVIFSSSNHAATIYKALEAGAKGFIPKPFKANDFIHYLTALSATKN